jgi:hypothetical protein
MSDFKTADHVIEVVSYEPPTVYTAQGSNFFFVPAGATHMRVKIWGPGGAGSIRQCLRAVSAALHLACPVMVVAVAAESPCPM